MISIVSAIYILIGILLVTFGSFGKLISDEVEKVRKASLPVAKQKAAAAEQQVKADKENLKVHLQEKNEAKRAAKDLEKSKQ